MQLFVFLEQLCILLRTFSHIVSRLDWRITLKQNGANIIVTGNWCELVLRKLGHNDVFCYVGDESEPKDVIPYLLLTNSPCIAWINVPNTASKVPPLVTGTFSGNDFTISVFGTVEE